MYIFWIEKFVWHLPLHLTGTVWHLPLYLASTVPEGVSDRFIIWLFYSRINGGRVRVELSTGKRRSDRRSPPRRTSAFGGPRGRGSPSYDDYRMPRRSRWVVVAVRIYVMVILGSIYDLCAKLWYVTCRLYSNELYLYKMCTCLPLKETLWNLTTKTTHLHHFFVCVRIIFHGIVVLSCCHMKSRKVVNGGGLMCVSAVGWFGPALYPVTVILSLGSYSQQVSQLFSTGFSNSLFLYQITNEQEREREMDLIVKNIL